MLFHIFSYKEPYDHKKALKYHTSVRFNITSRVLSTAHDILLKLCLSQNGNFIYKNGFTMTAVYHPAALLRDPRKKEDMYTDMKKIKELLDSEDR